jgi:hypothetical protein
LGDRGLPNAALAANDRYNVHSTPLWRYGPATLGQLGNLEQWPCRHIAIWQYDRIVMG